MSLKQFISTESIADLNDPQPVEYIAPDMTHQSVEVSQSPEMIDAAADVDATLVKVAQTEGAQVALEQYAELLQQAAQEGISEQSAAFLRVGLEHYEHLLGLTQPMTPSLEAFGGTGSRKASTVVSLEGIKEQSKEVIAQLKALFKQLLEYALHAYKTYAGDATRLKTQLSSIKQQINQLQGRAQPTVEINNPQALMIGNKFAGQDPTVLAGVVAFGARVYPSSLSTYIRAIAKVMSALDPASVSKETLTRSLDAIPGPDKNYRGGGQVLPGNVKLDFTKGEQSPSLTQALSKRLMIVKSTPGQAAQIGVPTADKAALLKRCIDLDRICDGIIAMAGLGDEVKPAVDELLKSAERTQSILDEGEVSAEAKKVGEDLLKAINVIPKMVSKDGLDLMLYCYRTTAAYIAVLKHEIAAYK